MLNVQLCEAIDTDKVDRYINSDDWWAEQKCDGHRTLVYVTEKGIACFNRKGERIESPGLILAEQYHKTLSHGIELLFDGELLTDRFVAFDCLMAKNGDDKIIVAQNMPLDLRRAALEAVCAIFAPPLDITPIARTAQQKRDLFDLAQTTGIEGLVFKNVHSPYIGRRTDQWLKCKFVKTVDCVVAAKAADGKDNLVLSLHDGKNYREVGKVKAIRGALNNVHVGDVVEVEYLYATEANRLYQPVFLRKRTDKSPYECSLDQLQYTSKNLLKLV